MKHTDYTFKLVAAIVLAGVVVAFAGPSHASKPTPGKAVENIAAVQADNSDTSTNSAATE